MRTETGFHSMMDDDPADPKREPLKPRNSVVVPIFGTPSPLTYWTINLVRTVIEETAGEVHLIVATNLNELREAWEQRNGRSVIFHSDIPQRNIVELFLQAEAPRFVIVEPPCDVVRYAQSARRLELRPTLRLVTQSFCTLSSLLEDGLFHKIDSGSYSLSLGKMIDRVIEFVKLDVSARQRRAITERLTSAGGELDAESDILAFIRRDFFAGWQEAKADSIWSAEDAALAHDVVDQYGALFKNKPVKSIAWRANVFPDRDHPGQFVDGPKALVGPARILMGGHTLHLPVGAWRASVQIEVTENFSKNRLLSQILLGDTVLAVISSALPTHGRYEFELEFEVDDPFFPLQLLIILEEGAIEGQLELHSVRFDRIDIA